MKNTPTQKKGYVLITVMVIMTILLVIVYYLSDVLFSETAISQNQKGASVAFYLAEAGVQDAIYQIKNDPLKKSAFENGTLSGTPITPKYLIPTYGKYVFSIDNKSIPRKATITATGSYQIGSKTAQRVITRQVFKPNDVAASYQYDAALYSAGSIQMNHTTITSDSSMYSGGEISANNSTINIPTTFSNSTIRKNGPGTWTGTRTENYTTQTFTMIGISSISDPTNPDSYINKAKTNTTYFTPATFDSAIASGMTSFEGIVYVDGPIHLVNKNITVNGLLVCPEDIDLTQGSLTITAPTTGPSGLITMKGLNIVGAVVNIQGLVYVNDVSSSSTGGTLNVTGAIISREFNFRNLTLNLILNKAYVNTVLQSGTEPATFVFDQWEEEY